MQDLTPNQLRELLSLDENTGKLYWLKRDIINPSDRQWNGKYAGKEAFTYVGKRGYLMGSIYNKTYMAHRVVFAIYTDEWPTLVDHINGDKTDNRPSNLRPATPSQNQHNQKLSKRNSSGIKGVSWSERDKRWCAQIAFNKKRINLGSFLTREGAAKAAENARMVHHNSFHHSIEAGVYRLESIQAGIL